MGNKVWYLPKFQDPSGPLPEINPMVPVRDNTRTRFTPPDYMPQQDRSVRPGSGGGESEFIASFIPGVGEIMGLNNARNAFNNEGFWPGMLELGVTGLGLVPVIGDAAGAAAKTALKGSKSVAKTAAKRSKSISAYDDAVEKMNRKNPYYAQNEYRKNWSREDWGKYADDVWRELEKDPNFDAIVTELSDMDDWYDLSEWAQINKIRQRLKQSTSRPEQYNPYLNLWDELVE